MLAENRRAEFGAVRVSPNHTKSTPKRQYVLVLVNGNEMMVSIITCCYEHNANPWYQFRRDLTNDGKEGGVRTARCLERIIRGHVNGCGWDTDHSEIIVRVYTTLGNGLGRMESFTEGFCKVIPLYDIIEMPERTLIEKNILSGLS
jgi:hypothetical protein